MEKITLNNELAISFPEGFRKLDEAEMEKLTFINGSAGICFRNDEKHILVSLGNKTVRFFASVLLNDRDIAKGTQKEIAKSMKNFNYQLKEYDERQVGEKTAKSFLYTYRAEKTDMLAECCVLKQGREFYYLNLYAREDVGDEALAIWENILKDAKWM